MTIPHSLARAARNAVSSSAFLQDPATMRGNTRPQLRRFEVLSRLDTGEISETSHIAPALPLFENAFTAFTRGTMIETDMGPVAIEDLLPGDNVITRDGSYEPVLWKGCTQIAPARADRNGRTHELTRIMADSFGLQKPLSYVLVGPAARILKTPGRLQSLTGGKPLLTPLSEFVDGNSVIETAPPTPVQMYHICLPRHAIIKIAGLEFETYHPGISAIRAMSDAMRDVYLGLFPHITRLTDFGQQVFPRAGEEGKIDAI